MSTLAVLAPAVEVPSVYRMSVEQYHEMIRQGIFTEGDRVELLEGVVVNKMTKPQPHCFATQLLGALLIRLLPSRWFAIIQDPVTSSDSEPEPDIAVIRGDRRYYLEQQRHPGPEETALVIEVAESSLAHDRGTKCRIYARAGIPQYWIVNLIDRCIEVYTDPTGPADEPAYQHQQSFSPDAEVPLTLDGQAIGRIRVGDLLL